MNNAEAQKNVMDMVLKNSHEYGTEDGASCNTETNWEEIDSSLREAGAIYCIDLNDEEDDPWNKVDTGCKT